MDQRSFFGLAEQLEALSAHGDPLEVLDRMVDFEYFRAWLVEGLGYGDGSMFKALILQAQHNLSDARMWDAAVGDIPDGIRSIARKPGQFITVEGARAALNTVQAIGAPDLSGVVVTLESHARRAAEAAFGVDLAGVPIEVNLK